MLLPLSYDTLWTRRTCYNSVVVVWVVNFVALGYAEYVYVVLSDPVGAKNYWIAAFFATQYITVGVPIALYALVLAVLLAKSLLDRGE